MINADTSRPNKNTLYIARSGAGKSQCLMQNKAIPGRGARVVLWDTNNDHKAHHFSDMGQFIRALKAANRSNWNHGSGFRIAYDGVDTVKEFERFCLAVMSILDGRRETFIICEELSAISTHAGKAPLNTAKLLNQCRKYGGIFHGTTQKPQEIYKTFFDQCEIRYIGAQKTKRQQKMVAEEIGCSLDDIKGLQPLEFLREESSKIEKIKLQFKKI